MAETTVAGAAVPVDATVENRPDLFGVRGQLRPDGDGGILSYMAADKPEYATPDVSDVVSGFYRKDRGLPWHVTLAYQLNIPALMDGVDGFLNAEQALEAMGANWEVILKPVAVAGTDLIIPGKFASTRSDTGEPLGIVGATWRAHQPLEIAQLGEALVDSGEAAYETGGLMHGGQWMFVSMELNHLDIVIPGDPSPLKTYLLIITAFDGSKSTSILRTQVRTVCKNTADLARKGALATYRVRHCSDLAGRVQQAREVLGISFKDAETVRALTSSLALTKVVDSQVQAILEAVWPSKPTDEVEVDPDVAAQTREKVFALYEASDTLEGIRGTAWGAFNAVTEYVDHFATYRGREQDPLDVRANSLLFGTGHQAKERALRAALELAK